MGKAEKYPYPSPLNELGKLLPLTPPEILINLGTYPQPAVEIILPNIMQAKSEPQAEVKVYQRQRSGPEGELSQEWWYNSN